MCTIRQGRNSLNFTLWCNNNNNNNNNNTIIEFVLVLFAGEFDKLYLVKRTNNFALFACPCVSSPNDQIFVKFGSYIANFYRHMATNSILNGRIKKNNILREDTLKGL